MSGSENVDEIFRRAVAAIDAGDVAILQHLLDLHPTLVGDRLEAPGKWLRDQVGDALDGFFSKPYLLWFVAEDPVRNGRLPANIAEIVRVIVDAAQRHDVPDLQDQLDSTLRLVCWSGVAADCGVQLEMIDVLIDAGAAPAENANNALVNGHVAAAEHLVARGAELTLASALCLGRWGAVPALAAEANPGMRQFAFVLAALNGNADGVAWLVKDGIPVNEPSGDLYSHGTPLHHAVCSGSLETVQVLVNAGADVNAPDSAWHATPLGWAEHYESEVASERRDRYSAIASYLRERVENRGSRMSTPVDKGGQDAVYLRLAFEQASKSYDEGGLPIGAVMIERGEVIALGHNRRVQDDDPTAHGEMDCLRHAGRRTRYDDVTMYTTLSPCMMCSGTIVQFGIRRVVIGENRNFPGNIDFLRDHGVEVHLLDDADCAALMARFIREHPDLWDEDIAGRTTV